MLADKVLDRHGAARHRSDPLFPRLLALLGGFPLAIEVVLANLARQTPAEVLAALQAGDVQLDSAAGSQDKTRSILRCIEYSHSNLAREDQQLLLCLFPFIGVVYTRLLQPYAEALRQQPALAGLPVERLPAVVQQAVDWGLLSPHCEVEGFLSIQPTLPYFLRSRLREAGLDAVRSAIETVFRRVYDQVGGELAALLRSQEAKQRSTGQVLASLEYENLVQALDLALAASASTTNVYDCLSAYLDTTQEHGRALELGQRIITWSEGLPPGSLSAQQRIDVATALLCVGNQQLQLKRYAEADGAYHRALALLAEQRQAQAPIYHQLGMVAEEQRRWAEAEGHHRQAQEQRRWAEAEGYYRQALAIYVECRDRYSQASTYHQLGLVAQEQRRWEEAEGHYRQALALKVEFEDRYSRASTHHQLGMVAQEQRRWAKADWHYRQALELFVEFNDRYNQVSAYHQLGSVAEEQRRRGEARDYFLKALAITAKSDDPHGLGITLRSLARLWQVGGDDTLPAAVAKVLGITLEDVAKLLRAHSDDGGDAATGS